MSLAARKNPFSPITSPGPKSSRKETSPIWPSSSPSMRIRLRPSSDVPAAPKSSTYSESVPAVDTSTSLMTSGWSTSAAAEVGTRPPAVSGKAAGAGARLSARRAVDRPEAGIWEREKSLRIGLIGTLLLAARAVLRRGGEGVVRLLWPHSWHDPDEVVTVFPVPAATSDGRGQPMGNSRPIYGRGTRASFRWRSVISRMVRPGIGSRRRTRSAGIAASDSPGCGRRDRPTRFPTLPAGAEAPRGGPPGHRSRPSVTLAGPRSRPARPVRRRAPSQGFRAARAGRGRAPLRGRAAGRG